MLLAPGCLVYSSTLKMKAVYFLKTSVNLYQTTQCHIPEESVLYVYIYSLFSYDVYVVSFMMGLTLCSTAASHMFVAGALSSWTTVVKIWILSLCQDSIAPGRQTHHATREWHLDLLVW
jgi:hypothetical protein